MGGSRRRDAGAAVVFGGLLLILIALEWIFLSRARVAGILGDLAIYREAIQFAAAGGHLYEYVYIHPVVHGLGFTYPPFAVIFLAPLTWFSLEATEVVWVAGTFTLSIVLVWVVVSRAAGRGTTWLGGSPHRERVLAATFVGSTLLMMTFTFLHQLGVGQISLVIIALVLIDQSGLVPKRWQGVLTGVAAAVKLTPLIFLPYFVITRQWRQAVLTTGTFAAATGLAAVVMPSESLAYWGSKVFQTSRVGRLDSEINKSILGTLSRWEIGGDTVTIWWIVLSLLVTALALLGARRHYTASDPLAAALLVGCLGTLLSPITWPHHQTWAVLAGIWLLLQRRVGSAVLGAVTLITFSIYAFFLEAPNPDIGVRLGWDLPTLAVLAMCLLGLPTGRMDASDEKRGEG